MTDVVADQIGSENFLTQGNVSPEKLQEISTMAEAIASKSKLTKKASEQPFVRGNATVFVFAKRYDFGEFGADGRKAKVPADDFFNLGTNSRTSLRRDFDDSESNCRGR